MRKQRPEQIPPLCDRCQSPMFICNQGYFKVWKCKNEIECGGSPVNYQEKKKKKIFSPPKMKFPYKE